MPVDIDYLETLGGSAEKLKGRFQTDKVTAGSKSEEFIKLCASRISDGLNSVFRDAKYWWAIDRAYDINQNQVAFTLVEAFLNRNPSSNIDVLSAARDWGLDKLMTPVVNNGVPVCDPATGAPKMRLDLPTFFKAYIPAVQAYHKVRAAKLFNDRYTYPLYPYDPIRLTTRDRLKADLITSRIQRMATDMGYVATERQSIHQSSLYGLCLNFPVEDWYTEKQRWNGKDRVIKEGFRYVTPHPARTFYDLSHPTSTINSDTGVSWAGYVDITRWGELRQNKKLWNLNSVGKLYDKQSWLKSDGWRLYQELFPCRFPFPDIASHRGAGEQDRVERADYHYYSTADDDQGVTLASLFLKIIPSDWELYDYDHPVWHRAVFAAEDTLVWLSPLAYNPVLAYLYDHDQARAFNSSLGLELMPWQDLLGNYLTQLLLSVKQNLINVVFWNKDLLDDKYIDLIQNLGEKLYRQTHFLPFSRTEWSWVKQTERDVFHRVDFPKHDVNGILVAINTMLNIMERMLGYTPEEIGARGSGEESATKTALRDRNRSVRLAYTGSFIDEARHARKKMLYDGMMAYSDDEILADIADLNDLKRAELKEMGFEIDEEPDSRRTRAGVRGSKKSLVIDGFATERDATNRLPDSQIAQMMIQTFQSIFSNPQIVERAGLEQLIDLFNQMLYYSGLPKDFRLRLSGEGPEQQQEVVQQQMAEMLQQVQGAVQGAQQAAQEVVQQEMTGFAEALKQEAIGPLQAGQQKIGQAIVAILQKLQEGDQRDGIQDQAISRLIQIFQTAEPESAQPLPAEPLGMA